MQQLPGSQALLWEAGDPEPQGRAVAFQMVLPLVRGAMHGGSCMTIKIERDAWCMVVGDIVAG